jgi:hypothetical protein
LPGKTGEAVWGRLGRVRSYAQGAHLKLDEILEGRIMTKTLLIVGLLLIMVLGAGCVVVNA